MSAHSQTSTTQAIIAAADSLLASLGSKPQTENQADWMLFRHCRAGHGDDIALCFDDQTFSYREVADAAASTADWLRSLGVVQGDSVVLVLPDCPVLAALYFAVVSVGAIAIILNPALPPEDLFYIAQLSAAKVAICDRAVFERVNPLRHLKGMIAVKHADLSWRGSSEILDSVGLRQNSDYTVCDGADLPAFGLLTSGSTGRPKLIVHRHRDILFGYLGFALPVLALDKSDRLICAAKMTTGYGLGSSLLMPFLAGASSVLVSDPPGPAIFQAIGMHRCTLLLAQPRLLAEALDVGALTSSMQSIRLVITGGEPLGASLVSRWGEVCKSELLDAYGNTEVGFLYISNRQGSTRQGSIGQPIAGVDVEIVDETIQRVLPGELGRLRVRGPSVISEYRGRPEATREHFKNGWFQTSDLASRDSDGYVYLHGRSDQFIKLGCGDWVNPNEVEMVLRRDWRVKDCAVIGAPDDVGLTILKAVVVTGSNVDRPVDVAAELASLVRKEWPAEGFKHLAIVEFVDDLPKTAAGKLDRSKLFPQSMTEFSYKC